MTNRLKRGVSLTTVVFPSGWQDTKSQSSYHRFHRSLWLALADHTAGKLLIPHTLCVSGQAELGFTRRQSTPTHADKAFHIRWQSTLHTLTKHSQTRWQSTPTHAYKALQHTLTKHSTHADKALYTLWQSTPFTSKWFIPQLRNEQERYNRQGMSPSAAKFSPPPTPVVCLVIV